MLPSNFLPLFARWMGFVVAPALWTALWLALGLRRVMWSRARAARSGLILLGRGRDSVIEPVDFFARQALAHNFFQFAHHLIIFGGD
jgi:hypothetical protein